MQFGIFIRRPYLCCMKVITIPVKKNIFDLSEFPDFHKSGSIRGMKKLYYGKDALLVRCGSYIYNVTSKPEIYEWAASNFQ